MRQLVLDTYAMDIDVTNVPLEKRQELGDLLIEKCVLYLDGYHDPRTDQECMLLHIRLPRQMRLKEPGEQAAQYPFQELTHEYWVKQ